MKYFVLSIKIFILSTTLFVLFPILNTRYHILDTSFANAQDVSIGVYPPIMQVDATAPAKPKADIFLENLTDKSVDISITYKPFTAANTNDGQIQIVDSFQNFPDPLFANRILILDQEKAVKTINLAPKQGKKLSLELLIPANEQKGDYYFSVIFSTNLSSSTLANASQVQGGVSMNVLLSIGPKGQTQGYIKDFSTPLFVNSGPVPFKVNIVNTSDHFIAPTGNITIKNVFGQEIGKVDLLGVNILSKSERFIPDLTQANPSSDVYKTISKTIDKNVDPVAIWPEIFLIGPYQATLHINLGDNQTTLVRSITFFAFPITYIIGLILIIIIVIFIILRVKKKIS